MTRSSRLSQVIFKSPILWGALASAGFYGLVRSEVLTGALIEQYFASHPVEYVATTMFFVGLAVLILKGLGILGQQWGFAESILGPIPRGGQSIDDCDALLGRLDRLPALRQGDYLVLRLREAIEHVRRNGSAESLDDQLKYLADLDAGRLHNSYALVRVIIWAIPVLGFLGTVIGITLAIANLAPGAMEDSLPQVIQGLSVAFATTTQALVLSIVLMFAQYYTDRKESALLARVDDRATAELEGRFEKSPGGCDGELTAVRRMIQSVIEMTQQLVQRQTELWRTSIAEADRRSGQLVAGVGRQLQESLGGALRESLTVHSEQLIVAEQSAAERTELHWEKLQRTQHESMQAIAALQSDVVGQVEVLGRAVEATGEVASLEAALNRNLTALSGAKNFEQMVMSLAAAIHLLNARLADDPANMSGVQLDPGNQSTQAA